MRLNDKEFIIMTPLTHKLIFSVLTTPGPSPNHLLASLFGGVHNNDLQEISGDTGLPWYRCEKQGQKTGRWQCKPKPPFEFGGGNVSDLIFRHF